MAESDRQQKKDFWDRFDPLWETLSLIFWGTGVTVLTLAIAEIASTALVPGAGAAAAAAILARESLDVAKGKKGKKTINFLLEQFRVPQKFHQEVLAAISCLFAFFCLGLVSARRLAGQSLAAEAVRLYAAGRLSEAKSSLELSNALDPESACTLLLQGIVREDLQDYRGSETKYREALGSGGQCSLEAGNNLVRLMNLRNEFGDRNPLELQQAIALSQYLLAEVSSDSRLKRKLFKNMGWTRQLLNQEKQARKALFQAMEGDNGELSAHCLLARLSGKDVREHALQCQNEIGTTTTTPKTLGIPEEDRWIIETSRILLR